MMFDKEFISLKKASSHSTEKIQPFLLDDENVECHYQSIRDSIIFTDKRIMIVDVEGIGKKKSVLSVPYSKIITFEVETTGVFDVDSELKINLKNGQKMRFAFLGNNQLYRICQIISSYIL